MKKYVNTLSGFIYFCYVVFYIHLFDLPLHGNDWSGFYMTLSPGAILLALAISPPADLDRCIALLLAQLVISVGGAVVFRGLAGNSDGQAAFGVVFLLLIQLFVVSVAALMRLPRGRG